MNLFLKWLYPLRAACMGCGSRAGCREDWVCPDCRRTLAERWVGAAPGPEGFDGAAYSYVYAGPAAGIVNRMKYNGIHQLAGFMAEDMLRAYRFIQPTGADLVTFVPMHPRRQRLRGYNHAELLARACAEALGLPCENAVERTRDTPQQARLETEQRRENLRDAFAPARSVEGRAVLLIDDVCTTGATARGCAMALRKGGAERVYLLCYAQARGQHPKQSTPPEVSDVLNGDS